MALMRSDLEGPTPEAAQPDPLANLLAHLRAHYPQSEQLINEVVNLGWRAAVGSAAARGDGRATVRAARAAIAPLVADGTFKTARAATVFVFGAYGWRQEIDAAVAVVRQAAVPHAEIFGYFETTRMTNEPGTMLGRGRGVSAVGEGGGPNSAAGRKTVWVFSSSAIVFARR
jgi:hypothetical protein